MTVNEKIADCKANLNAHLAEAARAAQSDDIRTVNENLMGALTESRAIMLLQTIDGLTGKPGMDRIEKR